MSEDPNKTTEIAPPESWIGADNPFERYGLDPREGIVAITRRLKELAEDAKDESERERIRAAWEELTLHPARRLQAARRAHPETREPLGSPPPLPRQRALATELTLRDLLAPPSAVVALVRAAHEGGNDTHAAAEGVDAPTLEADPLL